MEGLDHDGNDFFVNILTQKLKNNIQERFNDIRLYMFVYLNNIIKIWESHQFFVVSIINNLNL